MGTVDGVKDWHTRLSQRWIGWLEVSSTRRLPVSCSSRVVRGPCVQSLCQFLPPGTCFLLSSALFRQFPAPIPFFRQPGSLPLRLLPVTSCKSLPSHLLVFFRLFSSHFLSCYRHPSSLPQVLCQFLLPCLSLPSSFQPGTVLPVTVLQLFPSHFPFSSFC